MNPLKDLSQRYPRLAEILDQLSAAKGMNVALCNVLVGLVLEGA